MSNYNQPAKRQKIEYLSKENIIKIICQDNDQDFIKLFNKNHNFPNNLEVFLQTTFQDFNDFLIMDGFERGVKKLTAFQFICYVCSEKILKIILRSISSEFISRFDEELSDPSYKEGCLHPIDLVWIGVGLLETKNICFGVLYSNGFYRSNLTFSEKSLYYKMHRNN